MSLVKEYVLVPSAEFERMKDRSKPTGPASKPFETLQKREARKLHSKMVGLDDKGLLSDFDKNMQFSQMRQNFLSYLDEVNNKNVERKRKFDEIDTPAEKKVKPKPEPKTDIGGKKFNRIDSVLQRIQPQDHGRAHELTNKMFSKGF